MKSRVARFFSASYMREVMQKRLLASLALFLSSCSSIGQDGRGYPSLARRPAETARVGGEVTTEPAGEAAETTPADPALSQQLADLSGKVRQGASAFDALYAQVAGPISAASGAAVSSEAWVAAQVDLARLEHARYDSVSALASLDTLYAERMKALAAGDVRGGVTEILAARRAALVKVDAQNDRVDALKATLRQP